MLDESLPSKVQTDVCLDVVLSYNKTSIVDNFVLIFKIHIKNQCWYCT